MATQQIAPVSANSIDLSVVAGRASAETKLAHRVAAMLQMQIIAGGLEDGHSLGTAAEIRAQYRVGRWALREAVGILELRGIARLKSGPGGGIVVTGADFGDLVNLTLLYLQAKRSGLGEINEARRAVFTAVVKKLIDAPAENFDAKMADAPGQAESLLAVLAAKTGNGALDLAGEFVESVIHACVRLEDDDDERAALKQTLCVAIGRKDRSAALETLSEILRREERDIAAAWSGQPVIAGKQIASGKLAYRLALEIIRQVSEVADRSGGKLGSEIEIGTRFDASAETVRQAIRLIEDLGIVASQRGRHGGVVLREPNTTSIAALIPHLLAAKRVTVSACFEAARYISDEIARLAATRTQGVGKSAPGTLTLMETPQYDAMMIDRQIQTCAQNPLLVSIERGLGFYSCSIEPPQDFEQADAGMVIALSRRVLEAVENGDAESASLATQERFAFMAPRFAAAGRDQRIICTPN